MRKLLTILLLSLSHLCDAQRLDTIGSTNQVVPQRGGYDQMSFARMPLTKGHVTKYDSVGRYFYDTVTSQMYIHNGVAWVPVSGGGAGSVLTVFTRTGNIVAQVGDYAAFYQPLLGFTPENVANKAISFGTLNNTLYPSVLAVNSQINTVAALKLNLADTASMLNAYLRKGDTAAMLLPYLRKSDTAAMLLPYLRKSDTAAMLLPYLRKSDTAAMLLPYLHKSDTASMLNAYLRKGDTALMLSPYLRSALAATTYVALAGSYTNPSWIVSLPWSKITGTPTTVAAYGITDPIVYTSGSYANPAWITSLAYSKLTGVPSFITLTGLSATSPLFYDNTTGVFTIQTGSASQNGAISSTDWSTFNGKQNALGFTAENVANKATSMGTLNNTLYPTTLALSNYVASFGYGVGSVTSVGLGNISGFATAGGTPITGSGAFTYSLTNAGAHQYWGNNTGSSAGPGYHQIDYTELTGAPVIQVTINGTTIANGASVTITAAAGTLTGSTLNSGVTASSLLSLGATVVIPTGATGTTQSALDNSTKIATTAYADALRTATATFTNKRWTPRVGSTTSSATPTINTDNVDIYKLTAQAANITSVTTNLSGTPVDGDILEVQITGTGSFTLAWGASFVSGSTSLPTTITTTTATTFFQYYTNSSYGNNKWVCATVE